MEKQNNINDYVMMLGYNVYKKNMNSCLEKIKESNKLHIVSGNPEVLYTGLKNKTLFNNFTSKDTLIIPDGVGVQLAGKIIKEPVEEKIAGIDLMKNILKYCSEENKSVYLLGAEQELLEECIKNINNNYPILNICGYRNGFFNMDSCEDLINEIEDKKPYALFVAMGCPRQEEFIVKVFDKLSVSIFMGVGGSFDVIAGKINRAPNWMIKLGLEWLYRVGKEPWRILRLGSIPKFIYLVARNKKSGVRGNE